MDRKDDRFFSIIQLATVCVFWGRAWQHFFWDAPLRTLFWDQQQLSWIVEGIFQTPWQTYVESPWTDQGIMTLQVGFGFLYLLAGIAAMCIRFMPVVFRSLIWIGALGLIFLAILYWKSRFFKLGQLLEYSLQAGTPILLIIMRRKEQTTPSLLAAFLLLTAVTFISHGLYAIGYYTRPGDFTAMVMSGLGLSELQAGWMLDAAGVLDFVVAAIIFLPGWPRKIGLIYCIIWGFATSLARIWAHFYPEFWMESLHQWTHEFVLRAPHFLVPLALYYWYYWFGRERKRTRQGRRVKVQGS